MVGSSMAVLLSLVLAGSVTLAAPDSLAPTAAEEATSPSVLLQTMVQRHGAAWTDAQEAHAQRLDLLDPQVRDALAGVLQAYLDLDALNARLDGSDVPLPAAQRLDLVEGAETRLDAAARGLGQALAGASIASCTVDAMAPEYSFAFGACNDLYPAGSDYRLLVDDGGNDVYRNNAGGSSLSNGPCTSPSSYVTAVLMDYGGDDDYVPEDPTLTFGPRRGCGVNGGGYNGSGRLLDYGGSDEYAAGPGGVNGGAAGAFARGFLYDAGTARDTYEGAYAGINGGGHRSGQGSLLDEGGDDRYAAEGLGTNGGGYLGGVGRLQDLGGNDTYEGGSGGSNGGADAGFLTPDGSSGRLRDAGGSDVYRAGSFGVNGGAHQSPAYASNRFPPRGHLRDEGDGDDQYIADSHGANGGASGNGTVGLLQDLGGDDLYEGNGTGVNGGASLSGHGVLMDSSGSDWYLAKQNGVNGGATDSGRGILGDMGPGTDHYFALGDGTNGGGARGGAGSLWDSGGGTSVYSATDRGTNGGAHGGGRGDLRDTGGIDQYLAGGFGTNGGAHGSGSIGSLVDVGTEADSYEAGGDGANGGAEAGATRALLNDDGSCGDTYWDSNVPSGTGLDQTVEPKGATGAQMDVGPSC